jgi:hypothetical protein
LASVAASLAGAGVGGMRCRARSRLIRASISSGVMTIPRRSTSSRINSSSIMSVNTWSTALRRWLCSIWSWRAGELGVSVALGVMLPAPWLSKRAISLSSAWSCGRTRCASAPMGIFSPCTQAAGS